MKENRFFFKPVIMAILAALLLSMAAPMAVRPVQAATENDLVRLIVDNRSNRTIYLSMKGPAYYFFVVGDDDTMVYTVKPGEYTYTLTACGDVAKGEIDIEKHSKMIMPVCGGNAKTAAKLQGAHDLSKVIKIVGITVKNKSKTFMVVVLTGPAVYVFSLDKGEENYYTVTRGDYNVKYYACGKSDTRHFEADKGKHLILDCP